MARYRRRRSRRMGRGRRINWGRFLLFLVILAALGAAIFFAVQLLTGELSFGEKKPGQEEPGAAEPGVDLPTASPTPTPRPTMAPDLSASPAPGQEPSSIGLTSDIMVSGQEVGSYSRSPAITFGDAESYTSIPGVLTFGSNHYRNSFVYGTQTLSELSLTRVWEQPTGSLSGEGYDYTGTGTGWTGQPLIVRWPEETRKVLGIKEEFKNKADFTEVIYPTMDGKIYFLELETGAQTRDPLNIGVITKGTGAIDPRGYPLLYTGQGITSIEDGTSGAWFRVIDLIENEVVWSFGGVDPFSYRRWQAYDSSPLVHAETDTVIVGGENGVVYSFKLNSSFDPAAGTVSVNPEGQLVKYRYMADGYDAVGRDDASKPWVGIENSIAAFRNYIYFSDNGGTLQCVDINTLEPVFVVDIIDDSDATIAIEEDPENQTIYLYTANEVDKQPGAVDTRKGSLFHRKINGLTGEEIWSVEEKNADYGGSSSNGGTLTTTHIGKDSLEDIVIFTATRVPVTFTDPETGEQVSQNIGGRIVAYDKYTGAELWRYEQASGYWSTPVVVYNEEGRGYIIIADRMGRLRIHDPLDGGKILAEVDLGSRVESTPAVFGDWLVVGTRGVDGNQEPQKIIGVKIG